MGVMFKKLGKWKYELFEMLEASAVEKVDL